jgi:hypothetical protein
VKYIRPDPLKVGAALGDEVDRHAGGLRDASLPPVVICISSSMSKS